MLIIVRKSAATRYPLEPNGKRSKMEESCGKLHSSLTQSINSKLDETDRIGFCYGCRKADIFERFTGNVLNMSLFGTATCVHHTIFSFPVVSAMGRCGRSYVI